MEPQHANAEIRHDPKWFAQVSSLQSSHPNKYNTSLSILSTRLHRHSDLSTITNRGLLNKTVAPLVHRQGTTVS